MQKCIKTAERPQPALTGQIAVCIPVRNGGSVFRELASSITRQQGLSFRTLVLDSASSDGSVKVAQEHGFEVVSILPQDFNHGGTRQKGVELLAEADILVFLTQDAVLAAENSLQQLLQAFASPEVGLAYGRQLPARDAGPFGAHARLFNYPPQSRCKSKKDMATLGLKTAFVSNSFAAYRRTALQGVGGFPDDVILGEDMVVAARMLLEGWQLAYCAEAQAYHSHDYTAAQEFRRYFDTGVFHAREGWLKDRFGKAEGEGLRFIRSEFSYLRRTGNTCLWPFAFWRTLAKYLGYKLGQKERCLPRSFKRKLSMHQRYWD